jgi:hypothetical protein
MVKYAVIMLPVYSYVRVQRWMLVIKLNFD